MGRGRFVVRTDDHLVYRQMVVEGAGIGFLACYSARGEPGLRRLLPGLRIEPLGCWLAAHRDLRASVPIRRVWDYLADTIPAAIGD